MPRPASGRRAERAAAAEADLPRHPRTRHPRIPAAGPASPRRGGPGVRGRPSRRLARELPIPTLVGTPGGSRAVPGRSRTRSRCAGAAGSRRGTTSSFFPTYDVFDEARWFEPGRRPLVFELDTREGTRRPGCSSARTSGRGRTRGASIATTSIRSRCSRRPVATSSPVRRQPLRGREARRASTDPRLGRGSTRRAGRDGQPGRAPTTTSSSTGARWS